MDEGFVLLESNKDSNLQIHKFIYIKLPGFLTVSDFHVYSGEKLRLFPSFFCKIDFRTPQKCPNSYLCRIFRVLLQFLPNYRK